MNLRVWEAARHSNFSSCPEPVHACTREQMKGCGPGRHVCIEVHTCACEWCLTLQEDSLDLYCAPRFVEKERDSRDRDRDRERGDRDGRSDTSTFLRIDIKSLST